MSEASLSCIGRQRVGEFKKTLACRKNAFKHNLIQWNAGTACLSECVLKTLWLNCGPRGGTGGAKPGSGVQRFWGPLGASEFDPSFQWFGNFGVSERPSQRPLRAPERRSGPRGRLFRGLREVCSFASGKTRWATQRPLRVRFPAVKVPIFSGFPVENPTNKATASKLFSKGNVFVRVRFGGVPGTVGEVVRVRFCCSCT